MQTEYNSRQIMVGKGKYMDSSFMRKELKRLGLEPKVEGIVASVTLSNGVKLSTCTTPCFDPFSYLLLNIKKFYPSEITEDIYFYAPVKIKKLDDEPAELMKNKVQLVDENNIDVLLADYYSPLKVEVCHR